MMNYLRLFLFFSILAYNSFSYSQNSVTSLELYGFVMTDAGYQFNTSNPDWFDVARPTKLPSYDGEFAPDGKIFFSVRQSRFGVKTNTKTYLGNLSTIFEFELFGTGADAGQTTFRLRHAYGEIGKFGAGQTWSPFMDVDVFPKVVEKYGPPGMLIYRNIQIRYMPIQGDTRLTIALEKPGGSADQGRYDERIELDSTGTQFYLPNLTAEYRYADDFGHVEIAGLLGSIRWIDLKKDSVSVDGSVLTWGINLSSSIRFGKNDVLKLSGVYGEGISNYFNDSPVDVGPETNEGDPNRPFKGIALPVLGIVAYLDHYWSKSFSSSLGYSLVELDNSERQVESVFRKGQYASANLIYYPVNNVLAAVEYIWIQRDNKNGFKSKDMRVQFSFKYNFSKVFQF